MEIELRKHQNNLIIVGTGVIIMGFWSLAKALMMCTIDSGELKSLIVQTLAENPRGNEVIDDSVFKIAMIMVIAVTMISTLLALAVRVYVGKRAIAEARGRKKGNLYVALAVLLALTNSFFLAINIYSIFQTGASLLSAMELANDIVTIIVDLTCLITTLVMIHSVIQLRKITKEIPTTLLR